MAHEHPADTDEKSGAKRDGSKTETSTPAASGPHSPSAPSDDGDGGKTQDNRKGGYGAG